MTQEKIDRINELARKSKLTALSESEIEEQKKLRDEFRADFKRNLTGQLETLTIVEPDGKKIKVKDLKKDK